MKVKKDKSGKKTKVIKATLAGHPPIKIDFGCGRSKREGFLGVDEMKFDGVDVVMKIGSDKFPWADNSVEEAHASHFVEHLTAKERIHFVNELYRVLKPEAKFTMICPHWSSTRAYGDLTHQWPPVSEFWFYYLDRHWREAQTPHNDFYTCHYAITWAYNLNPRLNGRNQEFVQEAMQSQKDACDDIIATFIKKPWQ